MFDRSNQFNENEEKLIEEPTEDNNNNNLLKPEIVYISNDYSDKELIINSYLQRSNLVIVNRLLKDLRVQYIIDPISGSAVGPMVEYEFIEDYKDTSLFQIKDLSLKDNKIMFSNGKFEITDKTELNLTTRSNSLISLKNGTLVLDYKGKEFRLSGENYRSYAGHLIPNDNSLTMVDYKPNGTIIVMDNYGTQSILTLQRLELYNSSEIKYIGNFIFTKNSKDISIVLSKSSSVKVTAEEIDRLTVGINYISLSVMGYTYDDITGNKITIKDSIIKSNVLENLFIGNRDR